MQNYRQRSSKKFASYQEARAEYERRAGYSERRQRIKRRPDGSFDLLDYELMPTGVSN